MTRDETRQYLTSEAAKRILILDGAMGTMIQRRGLSEEDFRGDRFKDWPSSLKGNNDLLNVTQPKVIEEITLEYLRAGADLVGTNTFNATAISQADYGMEALCYELNKQGAAIAKRACEIVTAETPDRPRFVIGALGPMSKTLSLSPDVNDPGFRAVSFDEVHDAYKQAVEGLIDGGADLLAVETIFDTLNAKAAIVAIEEVFDARGEELPVIISGTITDLSGRTLSGQTVEAFWNSIRHVKPFAVGLNCSLGAKEMRPHIAELARVSDTLISAYPNAGLPNEFGEYDETPAKMAEQLGEWSQSGLVNLVGGCCGSTPDHIRAIAEAAMPKAPHQVHEVPTAMRLSGLEPVNIL